MAGGSNCYVGGPQWLALPIAAVLIAFRLAQPIIDHWLVVARAIAFLTVLHAIWGVTLYRAEVDDVRGLTSGSLPYEPEWAVPAIALAGLLAVIAIHASIGDRGRADGWRAWFSSRLQVAAAYLAFLLQTHLLWTSSLPSLADSPFPWARFAIGTVMVMGAMALWRWRVQRNAPAQVAVLAGTQS
jgi:hypothetical protein